MISIKFYRIILKYEWKICARYDTIVLLRSGQQGDPFRENYSKRGRKEK